MSTSLGSGSEREACLDLSGRFKKVLEGSSEVTWKMLRISIAISSGSGSESEGDLEGYRRIYKVPEGSRGATWKMLRISIWISSRSGSEREGKRPSDVASSSCFRSPSTRSSAN